MMKVIVVEPSKDSAEHLTFNSLVISSLVQNSSELISLASSKSHYEALGKPNVRFIALPVVSIVKRRFIRKVLVELFAVLRAFAYAKRNGIRHSIFLSVFPPLLNFLPVIAKVLGISTTVILHGELEGLVDSSRMRITSFGYWVRRFFDREGYRAVTCVVLSEGIYRRLLSLHPNSEGYVKWANHPIDEHENLKNAQRDFDVSTVGVATQKKHGLLFEKMADLARSGRRVAHIGMTEPEIFDRYKEDIAFFCKPGEHLGQSEFLSALKRVKHAIFPYAHTSYKMTVSGAMLDAIACGCNVSSLTNDFAKDLVASGLPVTIADSLDSLLHPVEKEGMVEVPLKKFSADNFCDQILSIYRN
jgi:hypothetical protein